MRATMATRGRRLSGQPLSLVISQILFNCPRLVRYPAAGPIDGICPQLPGLCGERVARGDLGTNRWRNRRTGKRDDQDGPVAKVPDRATIVVYILRRKRICGGQCRKSAHRRPDQFSPSAHRFTRIPNEIHYRNRASVRPARMNSHRSRPAAAIADSNRLHRRQNKIFAVAVVPSGPVRATRMIVSMVRSRSRR